MPFQQQSNLAASTALDTKQHKLFTQK